MEIETYRKNEKMLPFKFSQMFSPFDINKKFLNITNSSNEYNDYMLNFCQKKTKKLEHIEISNNYYICQTDSNLPRKKEEIKNNILYKNNLKDKQKFSSFFSENQHYHKFSSLFNKNIPFKISKQNFFSKYIHKNHSDIDNTLKLSKEIPLPIIRDDKINTSRSQLLSANTVLSNTFEIFYRKEPMPYEIIFSSEELKLKDSQLSEFITSTMKEYSSQSTQANNFIISENMNKIPSTQTNMTKNFNQKSKHEITMTLKPSYLDFQGGSSFKPKLYLSFKLLTILALLESQKQIEFLIHIIEYNPIFKTFSINESKAGLALINMHINIDYSPQVIIRELQSDKLKNGLNFTWLYNDKSFKFKLFPAKIEITSKIKNLFLTKTLDKDLLIFLVSKSFSKWEFYTLNYLILMKKFRNFARKLSQIHNSNKEISRLDCFNMDEDSGYRNPPFTLSTESIHLIYAFTTKDGNTYVLKLSPFYVDILNSCQNYKEIYEFNLRQSRILFLLTQYINVLSFLRKIFFLDKKDEIVRDIAYLDFLDEEYINKLNNYNIDNSEKYDPRGLIINLQYCLNNLAIRF